MSKPLPPRDIAKIFNLLRPLWKEFHRARILATGCTGFIGPWLLEPLLYANDHLNLDLKIWVLTRDLSGFRFRMPHLVGHPAIMPVTGDVRFFEKPEVNFTHAILGAASSDSSRDPVTPEETAQVIFKGTQHTMAMLNTVRRALFISSGAVYHPMHVPRISEDHPLATLKTGYGGGKQMAEAFCINAACPTAIARPFALIAPGLPLAAHYAAGNFLGEVLGGLPVEVASDGLAVRSYLYGIDLACWLFTIMLYGQPKRAYNVGSENALTVLDLAHIIAGHGKVVVTGGPSDGRAWYVPSTNRARTELGLIQTIGIHGAIDRTLTWHRQEEP